MLQNYETEEYLIGLALGDAECAERLAALPDDTFSYPQTIEVHKAIRRLLKEHKTPDMATVFTSLPEESADAKKLVIHAPSVAISPALYGQYEISVLNMRKRRILRQACLKVASRSDDPGEDVEQLTTELSKAINDNGNNPESVLIGDVIEDFVEDLERKEDSVYTGIAGIDRIVGGLRGGTLNILGARPKVGKTALGLSIATFVAEKSGPVLLVSLEMSEKEILARMFSAHTGIDMQKIVTKDIDWEEWGTIWGQLPDVKNIPIRISKVSTPMQIRREAAAMIRSCGLKMIMVDYIQLMRSDEPMRSRYEQVSSISRELKLMATDLDVPILALTQFNRDSEQGGVRRKPSMSEARDSGSIEQDCNLFIIQFPPTEPKLGTDMHDFWQACQEDGTEFQILEIAANRQGPTGMVPVRFDKQHMKFSTMRKDDER